MPRETLLSYLEDFPRYERNTCFLYDDGFRTWRYSYRQMLGFIESFEARLQAEGIGPQDKVLFWSENRPEWIAAFWGCLKRGAIVVPIDSRSSPEFVSRVQQIVAAKLLLVGEETEHLQLNIPVWELRFEVGDWESTMPSISTPQSESSVMEIVFTSGTTGTPKGVMISHKNILANLTAVEREVKKYRRYIRWVSPLRFFNLLPLSHLFGQVVSTFIPPMLGGLGAFQKGYNPRDMIALIRRERISVLICVPKLLDVLKEYVIREFPEVEKAGASESWSPLRRWWRFRRIHARFGFKFWAFTVGAAPLPRELEDFWSRLGFLIVQGYGLTETAPLVSVNHPFNARRGSLGKPVGGIEVMLAEDGEILIRGDNVTSGYYNAPEETAQAFQEGWFRTGDVGEMDTEGRLYYRGRKKEMIVTPEGLNVFPEDVEGILNGMEGVRESAVVGISAAGEERVHAAVILDPGMDLVQVQRTANERLEEHQKIRSISLWPEAEFPRTEGTAKLKRTEIRVRLQGQTSGMPSAGPTQTVEKLLADLAGREPDGLQERMKLDEDLGLSSLERVELLVALENRFNVSLDDQQFAQAREVADLKQLVSEQQQTRVLLEFPRWASTLGAALVRAAATVSLIVPLTRLFAWIEVQGKEHLSGVSTPVLFAANHQSHLDVPAILCALPWRFRFRLAVAMSMEFFSAHFWPARFPWRKKLRYHLEYYSACLFFQGFPLPQHQLGVRHTLRYMGELLEGGSSLLLFPQGARSTAASPVPFQAGVGLMADFLKIPVVPVRIDGIERVFPVGAYWPRAGRVRVSFGAPVRVEGSDYARFAKELEGIVNRL